MSTLSLSLTLLVVIRAARHQRAHGWKSDAGHGSDGPGRPHHPVINKHTVPQPITALLTLHYNQWTLTMLQTRSRTRPAGTTETRVPAALCFYSQSSSSARLTVTSARTESHEGCKANGACAGAGKMRLNEPIYKNT